MPVERDINLDKPLTDEEIRALEEEADNLERLAREAQEDANKAKEFQKQEEAMLNDAVKKIEELEKQAIKAEKAKNKIGRSIKEVNQLAQHRGALSGMGGDDPFEQQSGMGGMGAGAGQISGGRTGFGTGQENAPFGGLQSARERFEANMLEEKKKSEEERKALREADKVHTAERKAMMKKFAEQRAIVSKVQRGEQEFFAMSRNPIGFGMGKMTGMLAKGGIYGIIALAVISMAQQVFEEVKKLYAPGGPFDVRKQMMDRDREMIEMDHLLARRAGRVFFTSDTDLIQGPIEMNSGNTDRVVNRSVRYQALHLGE